MKKKQYKAVFRARIDFKNDEPQQEPLVPGHSYYLENERKVSYSDITNEAERIINNDLKVELQKYLNLSIQEVQSQSVYEGSIEIIYNHLLEVSMTNRICCTTQHIS